MAEKRQYIHHRKPLDYEISLPGDLGERITARTGIDEPNKLPQIVLLTLQFDSSTQDLAEELKIFLESMGSENNTSD